MVDDVAEMTDRATVFGEVAETYDRLRPSYPPAMYDDLMAQVELSPGSLVLEIGCGTGLATVELLRRGLGVVALDPDPRMLQLARRRLAGHEVEFIERRFEDYDGADPFDLIFAAGSWHWVDPGVALPLAASLLHDGGILATCWNLPRPESTHRPSELDDPYRAHAPELADVASQVKNRTQEQRRALIATSGFFRDPRVFAYRWSHDLSTAEYCDLLSTHSDHRMLGPERLATLLTAIGEIIDREGGAIHLAYESVLYVSRKAT